MIQINSLKNAWLTGAIIIVLIVAGDILSRKLGFGGADWMLYFVWGAFMLAVFATTFISPSHKLILGMSHTITISLLFALSNWIQSRMGMAVDLGGDNGFGVVFALIYVTSFIPALIASVMGLIFSKRSR